MFDLTLRTALVVSIDDPDQQGKIQISIESVSEGWRKDLLPWAIPLISNVSNGTMEMHLPKEGSQVWVLVDKYFKRFYYLSNRYFYNMFDFSKVSGLLNKCDKIDTEYKNIDFKYYLDGTLVKEIEKDEIITVNGDKKETVKGKNTVEIGDDSTTTYKGKKVEECKSSYECTTQGAVTLKAKTSSLVEIGNAVATLGSILTELCQDLSTLTTQGNEYTQTSPTLTAQMASLLPKIKLTFK